MKNIYRRKNNRIIAGVCGGIADSLGIDAAWVRVACITLTLLDGVGFLLYLVGWLLLPERSVDQELDPWNADSSQKSRIGGMILIGAGVAILANRLGMLAWLSFSNLLPLALILGGVLLVLRQREDARP